MTFDNSKSIISFRIWLFSATVVLLAFIAMAFAIKMIRFPLLGLSETVWTVILVAIWLFMALVPMVLNYQYISYSDEGEMIILRYFTAGIIGGKKNSLEMNKLVFAGYKIDTKFFGLIQSIILYQKVQQGVAKYPPVYISALSKEDKSKLIRSLDSITQKT
jgi:hypothetical protein